MGVVEEMRDRKEEHFATQQTNMSECSMHAILKCMQYLDLLESIKKSIYGNNMLSIDH